MDFKDIKFEDENFNNRNYLYNYIKQEIDNMGFFRSNLKMKKVGTLYKSICPFHNEKTASFTVYPNNKSAQKYASFYCFGCGATGDIIKFKQLKDNLNSYYESALQLAMEYKLDIENENDIKLNYLQSQLNVIDNSVNNLSLDKINLACSTIIRNYLQSIKNKDYFKNHLTKINQYYKYLDNELEERNAIQAQSLINETIQFIQNDIYNNTIKSNL